MEFKEGDIVRIREWDDMVKEFGLIGDYSIPCRSSFTKPMKPLCGKEFSISHINGDGIIYGHNFSWTISSDMIEHVCFCREEFNDDTSDIEEYLSEYMKL